MVMLRLTRRSEYGLMALAFLGQRDGYVGSARHIVEELRIPKRLLAEVLKDLTREGLLKSSRGPGGGYRLINSPASVTLADVVMALEGPVHVSECEAGACSLAPSCRIQNGISRVGHEIQAVLQTHTIADMTSHAQTITV